MCDSKSLPSVSIIIPVFRVRDYIEDCLRSVIAQDYDGEIECILIDDRGEDGSIELAEQFIAQNTAKTKFSIVYNEKNSKQATCRNVGMSKAHGDYVYFLDSDDWIDSSTISMMVAMLDKYPTCEIVQGGITRTNPKVFRWLDCQSWKLPQLEYSDDKAWIEATCSSRLGMIPMTPVNKLMKRQFLVQHNFRFVEGIYHEDEIWLAHLAKHLRSIAFCHVNNYHYRIHAASTTGGGQIRHYNDWRIVWQEIFKLFDKSFCPARMLAQIERDTTLFFFEADDCRTRRMLVGIKLQLARYCALKQKIHIFLWIVKNCPRLL